MGLIEVHLHDPEFSFAPFSSTGQESGATTDADEASGDEDDLYFPNDEDESGGLGGLLVLAVLIVAAVVVRKLVGGSEDLPEFDADEDA